MAEKKVKQPPRLQQIVIGIREKMGGDKVPWSDVAAALGVSYTEIQKVKDITSPTSDWEKHYRFVMKILPVALALNLVAEELQPRDPHDTKPILGDDSPRKAKGNQGRKADDKKTGSG